MSEGTGSPPGQGVAPGVKEHRGFAGARVWGRREAEGAGRGEDPTTGDREAGLTRGTR